MLSLTKDRGAIDQAQSPEKYDGLWAELHITPVPLQEDRDLKSTKLKGKYFKMYTLKYPFARGETP